jgi:drug/metabolite transporter (DMT)-like permease
MTKARAHGLLLLAALFWGLGNVAQKTVLGHMGPLTAVGLRCLLAFVVLAPFLLLVARSRPSASWLRGAVLVAVLFAAALCLQQAAYLSTSVTNASFLVNTATVMTPLVAWLILQEAPGRTVMFAALVTLAGASLMAGVHAGLEDFTAGDLLCMASAALYASWMVALGRLVKDHDFPLHTALMQFALAALICLPIAAAFEVGPTETAIWQALPELVVLGLFSTAGAFGLQTYAQRFTTASTAAVLVSAESVFGALGAYLILSERAHPVALAGGALIMAAIVMVAAARPAEAPARAA